MRCRYALVLVLAIGVSLLNSHCLAQDDTSTTEGSCTADNPETCDGEASAIEIELDVDDIEESEWDDDEDDEDEEDEDYDEDDDEDDFDVEKSDCQDDHPKCSNWAEIGECDANPNYMLHNCRRSCMQCPDQAKKLARMMEEKRKKMRVWTKEELEVAADMGKPQNLVNEVFRISAEQSAARIIAAREHVSGLSEENLKEICKNDHDDCTTWAVAGECEKNYKYMGSSCAPVCFECEMLLLEKRCPIDPNAKPAWEPGSLNAMFEHLISEPIASKYPVTILSKDPWVVTLDDVVSEEEAVRLIELGGLEGYKRSEDVGAKKADGTYGSVVSKGRTSSNAWCTEGCYKDPTAIKVMDRLSGLTMINERNSEFLQLLRYEPGQFYEDHHDYILHNRENQQGVRILTSYLYLNDVEAGGGTMFTDLNITVMPKRGRALFWPSVLNDSPHDKDERTNHQALPVEAGIKYGANGWYHQFDFKTPFEKGCSG